MPTDSTLTASGSVLEPDARRILRLAIGTTLSLWVSQIGGWSISFIAPVLTMFMLALPLPAPSLKQGIGFVVALAGSVYAGIALLPLFETSKGAGIGIFTVALFYTFYFSARGGSPILGAFMTVGLSVLAAVGSVNIDAVLAVAEGVSVNAVIGIIFVWVGYALLPEPPPSPAAAASKPAVANPDPVPAARSALRSMLIVYPIALLFFFSSASASWLVVMIKVASMGQQVGLDQSRAVGRSLIASTVIGGIAAIIAWQILSAWPTLIIYTLIIAGASLFFGRRIFHGAGMHAGAGTWSYGFLTMLVVLAPAVMDGPGADGASSAFYTRLGLFLVIAWYGSAAVAVFDAFWPIRSGQGDAGLAREPR